MRHTTRLLAGGIGEAALARFYTDVLAVSFPPTELMDSAAVLEAYTDPDAPEPALFALDGEDVVAGLLGETYLDGRVLLIAYLAVHPGHRNRGLGAELVGEAVRRWRRDNRPELVLTEIEDPRAHPATRFGDPAARLRFWNRTGARVLAMPYLQPALRPDLPRVPDMLLLELGSGRDAASAATVAAFLAEYVDACEGPEALRTRPFAQLLAWLAGQGAGVPLWPLARAGEVPRLQVRAGGP